MTKNEIIENLDKSAALLLEEGTNENDGIKIYLAGIYISLSLQIASGSSKNLKSISKYLLKLDNEAFTEIKDTTVNIISNGNNTIH